MDRWFGQLVTYIPFVNLKQTSTTPSCSGPIPAQKSRANSVPGGGIMKLLNLQLSTDGQFDWSKRHGLPIKLSISAYLQV